MAVAVKTGVESSTRTQTREFVIPGLKSVKSVSVNTGNVELISVAGETVTVRLTSGAVSRTAQTGGSYTPADSKTVTEDRAGSHSNNCDGTVVGGGAPSSVSYNSGGYSGTLSRKSVTSSPITTLTCPVGSARTERNFYSWDAIYSGTVTRPASDTRTYTNYYQYTVTIDYVDNSVPALSLNTTDNRTLYENDTFVIDGQASDSDNGNVVIVRYQIDGGTAVAFETKVSDGISPISFSRQLTFKAGKLHYNDVAITGTLTEGTAHQLKVWAEDDQSGKSAEEIRTFYAVPNRAPAITVDSIVNQSDLINADKLTITGSTSDLDGNDVVVKYKVNNSLSTQIYSGPAGSWTFDLSLKDLVDGENSIVLEVTDTYNFKTSRTIKLNKTSNATPLNNSVQRYKIVSPTGSAQGVLLWIQREATQTVSAEISMTNGTEQEAYSAMTLSNTAPVSLGIVEDQFEFQAAEAKEDIQVKLNISGTGAVALISGVLS